MDLITMYACQDVPVVGECIGLNYDLNMNPSLLTALPPHYRLVDKILKFSLNGEEILSITPEGAVLYRGSLLAVDPAVAQAFHDLEK